MLRAEEAGQITVVEQPSRNALLQRLMRQWQQRLHEKRAAEAQRAQEQRETYGYD